MEFRQLLLCAGLALLLSTLIVSSSPVVYLEKNGGRTHSEVGVGTPWESCSKYLCDWIYYFRENCVLLYSHSIELGAL